MTTYTKTDNYGLNLYGDTDPADLRDGYNGSMQTIDTTLESHLNRIEGVESRETHDEEVVKALLGDNTVDAATSSKTKWDKAGSDATQAITDTTDTRTRLAALGADTTENATAAKTKWDKAATDVIALAPKVSDNTGALTALHAETEPKATALYDKITKAGNRTKSLVVFGDSWTLAQDAALITALQSLDFQSVKSYGVDGATIQMLPAQATRFQADTSIDKSQVTDVIVVCGTNNVFYDRACTEAEAKSAATAIRNAFEDYDGVRFHLFPDNSRTANGMRNARYRDIMSGFMAAGFAVHPEYLWITGTNLGSLYAGDDKYGVQHLTKDGYKQLAVWMQATLNGADLSNIKGAAQVRVSADSTSNVTFADQLLTVVYSGAGMQIYGYINGVTFRESATDAQKKNPTVVINFNTSEYSAHTLPCAGHSDSARPFLAGPSTDAMTRETMEGTYNVDTTQGTFKWVSRANANRMLVAYGFRSFVFNDFIPLDYWLGEEFPVSQPA